MPRQAIVKVIDRVITIKEAMSSVRACPGCGGDTLNVLGILGRIVWFRCRRCGIDVQKDLGKKGV